jgi:hypothetical protein
VDKIPKQRRAAKKEIMSKQKILINHWRWLEQQGSSYKQQAASCKRQAASLTREHYNDILQYKGERLCKQKKH